MQKYRLRQSLRTFSSSSVLRADSTSLQPTRASWYATCLPIPLDAPVTHATWPFRTSEQQIYKNITFVTLCWSSMPVTCCQQAGTFVLSFTGKYFHGQGMHHIRILEVPNFIHSKNTEGSQNFKSESSDPVVIYLSLSHIHYSQSVYQICNA